MVYGKLEVVARILHSGVELQGAVVVEHCIAKLASREGARERRLLAALKVGVGEVVVNVC